jgi:hypothetical protein
MFESMMKLKYWTLLCCSVLFCHRALYAGLAGCHGAACWLTDKPELYGPMALLYAILALRG